MKGHRISYNSAEMKWLSDNRLMVIGDYHHAFCAAFARTDVSAINLHSLRKRKGWKTGRTGCFEKGIVPMNKGRKMPFNANSARTQFKKGNLPHNANYLWHERLSKDGYIEISVDETNPHTGFERRYVLKHRYIWEQEHGPIPEGMILKCLDGNKQNTDISNWELLPRATLPYLNGHRGFDYEAVEPELKPAVIKFAKLKHVTKVAKTKAGSL